MEENKTEVVEQTSETTNEQTSETMTTQPKKSKKKLIIILSLVCVLIIGSVVGFIVLNQKDKPKEEKPVEVVERYFEPANPTALQQEIYKALLEADRAGNADETRKLVAASFVVDFLTWSNKASRQDVGGTIYFIEPWKATFGTNAIQTYYRDFNELKNQFNQGGLPEVETYTVVSMEPTDYVLKEPLVEGNMNVVVDVTYVAREIGMPTDTLPKSMTITIGTFEDRFVVLAVNYDQVTVE